MSYYFNLQWHITTKCNNNCKHCYMKDDKTYQNEVNNQLEFNDYIKILNNYKVFCNYFGFKGGITLSNSPTQRAGYKVVSNLPKVKHDIPLLSLDKVKEIPKLVKWLGDKQGVLMLKIDGGTGKITYQQNQFKQFTTRGDSETNIGEDISHNVYSIKNIPLKINDENEIQIVGENYMKYSSFNELNSRLKIQKINMLIQEI